MLWSSVTQNTNKPTVLKPARGHKVFTVFDLSESYQTKKNKIFIFSWVEIPHCKIIYE